MVLIVLNACGCAGGLKYKLKDGEEAGNIVMEAPGFFGVPPAPPSQQSAGSILRKQVTKCLFSLRTCA